MKENKKIFISYLDDNDTQVNSFVEILEASDSRVVFLNGINKITLPMNRVLKMKERYEG